MTRVVCRQLAPNVGGLEDNLAMTVNACREAVWAGAQLVVLPELSTSGYVFRSREEAVGTAIPSTHHIFKEWANIASSGSAVLVIGFCEQGDNGQLHNSAAVVDGSGLRHVYRKTHLWDTEKTVFEPGVESPAVIDTPAGRIGVLVCYDLEFPEMTRSLALAGADIIAVPTNWPLLPRLSTERAPEIIIAMAAARVNRVAIACCDRSGAERGVAWTEGTTIIGVDGWVAATADENGWAVADLDLVAARDKSLSEHNDAMRDRRPELYSALAARHLI